MTNVYSNFSSLYFDVAKYMQKNGVNEAEAKAAIIEQNLKKEQPNLEELEDLDKPIDYEELMNTFISKTNANNKSSESSYVFDKDNKTQTIKIGNKSFVVGAEVSGNSSIQIFIDNEGKISVFNNGGDKISFINADKDIDLDINIVESEKEIDIVGGHGNNTIVVQQNAKVGNIFGQEGNDIIVNAGSAAYIDGNDGNDIILNSGNANYLDGWNGNDIIYNNGNVKRYIWGFTGNDKIINDKNGKAQKILDESGDDRIANYGSARIKNGNGMDIVINKKVVIFADGTQINLNENEIAFFDDLGDVVIKNQEDNLSKIYSSLGKLTGLQIGETIIPSACDATITKNADGSFTINHTHLIQKEDGSVDTFNFTTNYSKDGNLLKVQFGDTTFESKGTAHLFENEDNGFTIIDIDTSDEHALNPNQNAYIYSPYGVLENEIIIENNTITFKNNSGEISNVELNNDEIVIINPDRTVTVITNNSEENYNVVYSKEGVAISTTKEIKIGELVENDDGTSSVQWNNLTFENLLNNEMVLIGSDGLPLSNITGQEPYLAYDRKTHETASQLPLNPDGVYFYMQNPNYTLDNINALLVSGQAMCITEDFSIFLNQHFNPAEQKYYYTDETGNTSPKTFKEMQAIWETKNKGRASVIDLETDEIFNPETINDDLDDINNNPAPANTINKIADKRNQAICDFFGWTTDQNITNPQYDTNGNITSFSFDGKIYNVTTDTKRNITGVTIKKGNVIVQKFNCTYSSSGNLQHKYEYNYYDNGTRKSYISTSFNSTGTKADEIVYTYDNSGKITNYKKQLFDLAGKLLYTREKSYVDSQNNVLSKIVSDKINSDNYNITDNCLNNYPYIYSFNSNKCILKFQGGKTITFKEKENITINSDGTVIVTDKDGNTITYNRRGYQI